MQVDSCALFRGLTMSNLVSRLKAPAPKSERVRCSITRLLFELPQDERDALNEVLAADSGWTDAAIVTVLHLEGHEIGESAIGKHRRGKHTGCK